MNARTRTTLRYCFAAVAAGVLVWIAGPANLLGTLRSAHPFWLFLYVTALAFVPVLYGIQVHVALRLAGHSLPATRVIASATRAWSIGTLTPARAGDLSLAYFLRGHLPESDAIAAVSVDKLLSLAVLAVLALLATIGLPIPDNSVLLIGAGLAIGLALCSVALVSVQGFDGPVRSVVRHWFGGRAEAAWIRVRILAGSPRVLAWCVSMTSVRWLYICGSNVLIFRAVAEEPGYLHIVAATAVGRIISIVPVSVGGIGIKEPAQILIYRSADVPADAVIAVSALGLACSLGISLIAPAIATLLSQRSRGSAT